MEHFAREIARAERSEGIVSVVMLDLKDFKAVNDRYGHPVGDNVLLRTARVVRQSLRTVDAGCRWGGDEFVAVLPNTNLLFAVAVAERIRKRVAGARAALPVGAEDRRPLRHRHVSDRRKDGRLPAQGRRPAPLPVPRAGELPRSGAAQLSALLPGRDQRAPAAAGRRSLDGARRRRQLRRRRAARAAEGEVAAPLDRRDLPASELRAPPGQAARDQLGAASRRRRPRRLRLCVEALTPALSPRERENPQRANLRSAALRRAPGGGLGALRSLLPSRDRALGRRSASLRGRSPACRCCSAFFFTRDFAQGLGRLRFAARDARRPGAPLGRPSRRWEADRASSRCSFPPAWRSRGSSKGKAAARFYAVLSVAALGGAPRPGRPAADRARSLSRSLLIGARRAGAPRRARSRERPRRRGTGRAAGGAIPSTPRREDPGASGPTRPPPSPARRREEAILHDLKSPLSVLRVYADLISEGAKRGELPNAEHLDQPLARDRPRREAGGLRGARAGRGPRRGPDAPEPRRRPTPTPRPPRPTSSRSWARSPPPTASRSAAAGASSSSRRSRSCRRGRPGRAPARLSQRPRERRQVHARGRRDPHPRRPGGTARLRRLQGHGHRHDARGAHARLRLRVPRRRRHRLGRARQGDRSRRDQGDPRGQRRPDQPLLGSGLRLRGHDPAALLARAPGEAHRRRGRRARRRRGDPRPPRRPTATPSRRRATRARRCRS